MRRFFTDFEILPVGMAESAKPRNLQALPGKFNAEDIQRALPSKPTSPQILQPLAGESEGRLTTDFSKHHHLGWTHYRILLGVELGPKRGFYFEQAAKQRWVGSAILMRLMDPPTGHLSVRLLCTIPLLMKS